MSRDDWSREEAIGSIPISISRARAKELRGMVLCKVVCILVFFKHGQRCHLVNG